MKRQAHALERNKTRLESAPCLAAVDLMDEHIYCPAHAPGNAERSSLLTALSAKLGFKFGGELPVGEEIRVGRSLG